MRRGQLGAPRCFLTDEAQQAATQAVPNDPNNGALLVPVSKRTTKTYAFAKSKLTAERNAQPFGHTIVKL
uniref:Uncharacterized protein n=1 Tax=Pseudomonas syringae pv. actinidiae TaxID=103796 RepID=A0A2P0QH52_PSESF|nr:hypothetical protein [Pseudomonas syringae pv. actinidiae]